MLSNVDLHVHPGEIVTLLGANGAGKTTFLNTVTGLVQMTSGRVFYGEADISRRTPRESRVGRGIALCPEGRRIFATMTVEENLRLGAGMSVPAHRIRRERRATCSISSLSSEASAARRPGLLSGGEQQMLAVGRALMSRPKLLLLDEPSLGLAPQIVRRIFELIRQLREQGVTILLVEQNVRMALRSPTAATCSTPGGSSSPGRLRSCARTASVEEAYLGWRCEP